MISGKAMKVILQEIIHHVKASQSYQDLARERLERIGGLELALSSANKPIIQSIEAVKGTWAWACRNVISNQGKAYTRADGGKLITMVFPSRFGIIQSGECKDFFITPEDITATDWREAE